MARDPHRRAGLGRVQGIDARGMGGVIRSGHFRQAIGPDSSRQEEKPMTETIFEALRDDHQTQRTLVDLLARTHGDSEGRQEIFGKLRAELQRHASAEERCFYKPLMDYDLTQEKARHSIAEHHEIDELIETLETTDPSSPSWKANAEKLRHVVHHHLDEEEQEVFQQAGRVLSDELKVSLASAYRDQMSA